MNTEGVVHPGGGAPSTPPPLTPYQQPSIKKMEGVPVHPIDNYLKGNREKNVSRKRAKKKLSPYSSHSTVL